ncbi:hypothetical protein LINGRAHAP2_LOCUS4009, partial [Linum grandiflorum]
GKLQSRWCGPFIVKQAFAYGTIEIRDPNGGTFKVNRHFLKHYTDAEDLPPVTSSSSTAPKHSRTSNTLIFGLPMSDESGAATKETCEDPYLSQLGEEDYEW